MTTHDNLSNNDIAFIAEMRSIKIEWKSLALIYGIDCRKLRDRFRYRMNKGIIYER